jgi:hypothetical protein
LLNVLARLTQIVIGTGLGTSTHHVMKLFPDFFSRDEVGATTTEQSRSTSTLHPSHRHNGIRVESLRPHVCGNPLRDPESALAITMRAPTDESSNSYNKYLSVAARTVRRSLKDDKRIAAERRGDMELRFAKWSVSVPSTLVPRCPRRI